MDRLIANGTVPFGSHDVAPAGGAPGMATDGNPLTGAPPTDWPAWAWNMLEEEVRNVVLAAGIAPDVTNWGQMAVAVLTLAGATQILGFAAAGVYQWVVPPGVRRVRVRVKGAGGGSQCLTSNGSAGSQSGAGGGEGGYSEGVFAVTPGQVIQVAVGAGGITQAPGGTSSFGPYCSATGGVGASFGGGGGGAYDFQNNGQGTGTRYNGGAGHDGEVIVEWLQGTP